MRGGGGGCYILRKGRGRPDLPKTFNGPIIDDWPFKQQAEALNKYKYCYLYDTQTGYATIAALCGCIPIIMLEAGKTKSDYVKDDDNTYGIAYGNTPEEIEYAVSTRDKLIEHLKEQQDLNDASVRNFLDECNRHFSG